MQSDKVFFLDMVELRDDKNLAQFYYKCTTGGPLIKIIFGNQTMLTLKDMGGWNHPAGQEITCHFSQDHAMVTKILDFIHKHPN